MDHHGHYQHWGQQHRHLRGHRPFFPGMFFFPPLMLLFGLFVVFFIFKTGLWIPLMLIAAFAFFARSRRGSMGCWGSFDRAEWQSKMKREFNEWHQWRGSWDDETSGESDKPKRRDSTEYV
jgi:hypothetical protein